MSDEELRKRDGYTQRNLTKDKIQYIEDNIDYKAIVKLLLDTKLNVDSPHYKELKDGLSYCIYFGKSDCSHWSKSSYYLIRILGLSFDKNILNLLGYDKSVETEEDQWEFYRWLGTSSKSAYF